jgi:hypothetical protein
MIIANNILMWRHARPVKHVRYTRTWCSEDGEHCDSRESNQGCCTREQEQVNKREMNNSQKLLLAIHAMPKLSNGKKLDIPA